MEHQVCVAQRQSVEAKRTGAPESDVLQAGQLQQVEFTGQGATKPIENQAVVGCELDVGNAQVAPQ